MAERTLLDIATSASEAAGVPAPASIVGNASKRARFLEAAINQTMREIRNAAANNDGWGAQQVAATLTTVANRESYDLPGDYDGLIPGAMHINGSPMWFHGPADAFHWSAVEANATISATPYRWRIKERKVFIQPVPTSVMTLAFEYLTRAMIESAGAGAWDVAIWDQAIWDARTISDRMLQDSDQPRVPDYVVELGLQWRLEQKYQMPHAETRAEYWRELEMAVAADKGGPPRSRTLSEAALATEVLHGIGENGGVVIT